MPISVGPLPPNTKGFDCNFTLDSGMARGFVQRGHHFVLRYVGRVNTKQNDLSVVETATLMRAGLSLMVVQHVPNPGWFPTKVLGEQYGRNAAIFANIAGYVRGAHLWCDLEGVNTQATRSQVIDYCNAWHDQVKELGYHPGLYVGYEPGLSARDLYYALRFDSYWEAYNLNADQVPAVRGVQMRQGVARREDVLVGMETNQIDVDHILVDKLGGTPRLMLAPGDR